MNILNVGYNSTNYYILADSKPRLLIDIGFPGTLPKLQHQLKRVDIHLADIKHLLATHYHPDHAGLAQELKNIGIKLIVVDLQQPAIPLLKTQLKPSNHYVEINLKDNLVITLAESRSFLAKLGIQGELIPTPGHSDDSVSLVLDTGEAFTGDLPRPLPMAEGSMLTVNRSWDTLRAHGVKRSYPGHGPIYTLE